MIPTTTTTSDPSDTETSPPIFEIKVAVIGDVCVDKSLVFSCLLRDKFGDMMSTVKSNTTSPSVKELAIVSSPTQWELVEEDNDTPPSEPNSKEIKNEHHFGNDEEVPTRRLKVELNEPLFEMRKDTQLVLVDIPGFNDDEADTKNFKNYVEKYWNSFDCIVIVVDWSLGVKNQVSLLQFVKHNKDFQQGTPLVIVFRNTMNDDKEKVKLVSKARQQMEMIFGVSEMYESLDAILDTYDMLQKGECLETVPLVEEIQQCEKTEWHKTSPVVVSERGVDDSTLQKVLSFLVGGADNQKRIIKERIKVLLSSITYDPNFVKKLEVIHKDLIFLSGDGGSCNDADVRPAFWQLCTALEQSYFDCPNCAKATDAFCRIATECAEYRRFASEQGWETEATRVVAAARSTCCRFFASMNWHFGFVSDLKVMYDKLKEVYPADAIDVVTKKALQDAFHRLIADLWRQTLVVVTLPDTLKFQSALVDEILEYDKLAEEAGLEYVRSYIENTFEFFLRYHLQGLCQKASDGLFYYSYMDSNSPKNSFASLTPIDWNRVFRSILLLRYDQRFCQSFGNEIVWMEYLIDQANAAVVPDVTGNAGLKPVSHNQKQLFMKLTQKGSQLVPSNGFNLSQTVVEIPPSFSDPNHFAHIAWRYCEFMEGKALV